MSDERSSIGTGIILVTVGLLFLADRQGYMSFQRLWPVILIAVGAVMVAFPGEDGEPSVIPGRRGAARRRRNRFSSGLWMIFAGVLFLANQNHWLSFRDSWPLFIVAGGLSMIVGSFTRRPAVSSSDTNASGNDSSNGGQWR
jgi:uncharacterized membrane protein HdeD (DUF308 family)